MPTDSTVTSHTMPTLTESDHTALNAIESAMDLLEKAIASMPAKSCPQLDQAYAQLGARAYDIYTRAS